MLTPENDHAYRLPRRSRTTLIVVLVLVSAVLGGLWWNALRSQHRAEAAQSVAEHRADLLQATGTALQKRTDALLEANRRLLEHGQQPVHVPEVPPSVGPAGPRGQKGDRGPGPSAAQVAQAISAYCGTGACTQGPTQGQVAAAVSLYCDRHGRCLGPQGAQGDPGAQGPQGDVGPQGNAGDVGATGPQGPAPTAAQVADAVTAYCSAHGNCRGAPGADAPSVTSIAFSGDVTDCEFEMTLSDGSTLETPAPRQLCLGLQ